MKSKIILSFLSFFFVAIVAYAQSPANMTNANVDMHYSISPKANTSEPIVIDVAIVSFKSIDVAKSYFPAISDNNLTYRFDGARYVYLTLNHYEGTPTRSIAEWNLYISNLFTHYSTLLTEINK